MKVEPKTPQQAEIMKLFSRIKNCPPCANCDKDLDRIEKLKPIVNRQWARMGYAGKENSALLG